MAGSQAQTEPDLTEQTGDEGLANQGESEEEPEPPQTEEPEQTEDEDQATPPPQTRTSVRARTPSTRTATPAAEPTAAKVKDAKATGVKRAAPAANTSQSRRGQRRRSHA